MDARAALPLFADSLVGDEELDGILAAVVNEKDPRQRRKNAMRTSVRSVDDTLDGNLEAGTVVGVSGEAGSGGSAVCLTLLSNSLLDNPSSTAAIIDTTGNLDILRIYALIIFRLQQDQTLLDAQRNALESENLPIEDVAAKVLDRVKIMRVFDFVGVKEAVGEIRESLQGKTSEGVAVEEKKEPQTIAETKKTIPRETVIADSEDEGDEEDEMLFDSEHITTAAPATSPAREPELVLKPPRQEQEVQGKSEGRVTSILIDNLAHVLNPLLKQNYIEANTLASSFLQILNHLTHTYKLQTILLNPCIVPRTRSPSHSKIDQTDRLPTPLPPQQTQQHPHLSPSIFSSNSEVLALGNILGRYTDVHILVSKMPKRKIDARAVAAYQDGGSIGRARKGPDMVSVVEVASDRWNGRVGAWGTFIETEQGIRET